MRVRNILWALVLLDPVWIYTTHAYVISLSLKTDATPITLTVPHISWPGLSNIPFRVSGQHTSVLVAALPNKIGSESARGFSVKSVNRTTIVGLNPVSLMSGSNSIQLFSWEDWVIFPHKTMLAPVFFTPSIEEFHLGLGRDSFVWAAFPDGATFCSASQTLNFRPSKVKSCLGAHVATLKCDSSGPRLRCGGGELQVVINKNETMQYPATVSPFDHRTEFSAARDEECGAVKSEFYYDRAVLSVVDSTGSKLIEKSGYEVVTPRRENDAQIIDEAVMCGLPEPYIPQGSVNVGLMGSGYSFVYVPSQNKLEIWESTSNAMRNGWYDVLVINLCLVVLVHWFFDAEKNISEKLTRYPELLGCVLSLTGAYFQTLPTGALYRVEDIENAQTAVIVVFWSVSLMVMAHISTIIITLEIESKSVESNTVKNVRKFSYEAALISSIFLQVMSGSMDVLDSYVSFMVGFSLCYNTAYRFTEMWVGNNHPAVLFISFVNLGAGCFAFYVTTAVPAMDPVASLSRFSHEASVLCIVSAVVFATLERTKE